MRKRLWIALLSIAGAAVVYAVSRYGHLFLAPLISYKATLSAIVITFVLRRLQRPIWALIIYFGIVEFIGFAIFGHYRRVVSYPIKRTVTWAYRVWEARGVVGRVLIAAALIAATTLIFWGATYRLGTVVWAWVIIEKIYYWIGNQLIDRGLGHWRLEHWIHRGIHRIPWLRRRLTGIRNFCAWILRTEEVRRSERMQRWHAWQTKHKKSHLTNAPT